MRIALFLIFTLCLAACQPGGPLSAISDIDAPTETAMDEGTVASSSAHEELESDTELSEEAEEAMEESRREQMARVRGYEDLQEDARRERHSGPINEVDTGRPSTEEFKSILSQVDQRTMIIIGWDKEAQTYINFDTEEEFQETLLTGDIDPTCIKMAKVRRHRSKSTSSAGLLKELALEQPGTYLVFQEQGWLQQGIPERFVNIDELKNFVTDPNLTFVQFIHYPAFAVIR